MAGNSGKPITAVLASGGGTNLQALLDAAQAPDFPAEIGLVVSNNPGAYCLERAQMAGVPGVVVNHRDYPDRPSFESELDLVLRDYGTDIICLAGFMRILTAGFVTPWQDRMINIHPSLLPHFKGLHTHERALAAGHDMHGCSVHFVRAELDDGPLIVQAEVPVRPDDTPDILQQRVLSREHIAYPLALGLVAAGRVTVSGDETRIDGDPGPLRLTWDSDGEAAGEAAGDA